MTTHTYDVVVTSNNHGYPYRAECVCGWQSIRYAASHAAAIMGDDHIATVTDAVDLAGNPHPTIAHIQTGVAGGWRIVTFRDGSVDRMTTTELSERYACDPFANVAPLSYA